ncbi:helix-turn-helix domain-containing protein [Enterococcus sp. ALS3]|uniref:Helix-turn-helix domain-containing protein n=1 Tax=Enterococcus alishanensis TaxID=1303817 RepID=A0ABS6TA42_9ENTE|nr:helix-turn-helix domain-containing protein [Enterococcus alishanensis]
MSDLEASELVKSVASKRTAVFRIVDTSVDEQKAEILKNEGFQEWITKNESFNELRELLFIYSAKQINQEKENKENKSPSISSWKLLKIKLSPVEERILDVLIEAKAATVSREDLVKIIWREDPNNSNLSQVSYRIKRIKHSIEEVFDIPDGVVTDWRKGYRLNDEFYQKIYESYELA